MEFLIVTGLSGSGKSNAIAAMEDIGYFCVDNLPPTMISVLYDLCNCPDNHHEKVAVVTDSRGGGFFKDLLDVLKEFKNQKRDYKLLFLEASTPIIVNRYQETRRKHPLLDKANGSIADAVTMERSHVKKIREQADFVVDTSDIKVTAFKERISKLLLGTAENSMVVHCMSFGYKHGVPLETNLMFDVRCFTNPFYHAKLRPLTGLDKDVNDFVMSDPEVQGLLAHIKNVIDYLIPLYQREGKSQLVIAIGCTGGRHRSVAIADYISKYTSRKNIPTSVTHRDITK